MTTPMTEEELDGRTPPQRCLFRDEDAERFFKRSAGKPYQPSNGTEGEIFMGMWCADCTRDQAFRRDPDHNDGCSIVADTMALDVSDPDYPKEWVYGADGQPVCTAFAALSKASKP